MFQLSDIRKTRVWQEAHEEGHAEGREVGREEGQEKAREQGREEGTVAAQTEIIRSCLANGMSVKQIAEITGISIATVRRLARRKPRNGHTQG